MKKQILLIASIVAVLSIGITFWAYNKVKKYTADKNNTTQLAPRIKEKFAVGMYIKDYPFSAALPNWGKQYLIVENGGTEFGIMYNSDWNEKLQTESNFPGQTVKGLVVIDIEYKDLGDYITSSGRIKGKAIQRNYILNYFDMEKAKIIARDTIIGDKPSATKSSTSNGMGDLAKDLLVIETIKNRIK
jgi:hypothetical protein